MSRSEQIAQANIDGMRLRRPELTDDQAIDGSLAALRAARPQVADDQAMVVAFDEAAAALTARRTPGLRVVVADDRLDP